MHEIFKKLYDFCLVAFFCIVVGAVLTRFALFFKLAQCPICEVSCECFCDGNTSWSKQLLH